MKDSSPWVECLLLIHGITPDAKAGTHSDDYNALIGNVNKQLLKRKKPAFEESNIFRIEWGSGRQLLGDTTSFESGADEYLAEVEDRIAKQILPLIGERPRSDPSLGLPLRPLVSSVAHKALLYGAPDIFYYVSHDGELAIRNRLFKQFYQHMQQHLAAGERVSLTIVGHSAGSVIAHDFLYHLFGKSNAQARKDKEIEEIMQLRSYRARGAVRLRRFYTIGSPIAALMIRSNSLMKRVLENKLLAPADIGLIPDETIDPPAPRWVNFWDVDDFISFPVGPIYAHDHEFVADRYVDNDLDPKTDFFPAAHLGYWRSDKIAASIAETF